MYIQIHQAVLTTKRSPVNLGFFMSVSFPFNPKPAHTRLAPTTENSVFIGAHPQRCYERINIQAIAEMFVLDYP
jgi:hypothetical protein